MPSRGASARRAIQCVRKAMRTMTPAQLLALEAVVEAISERASEEDAAEQGRRADRSCLPDPSEITP